MNMMPTPMALRVLRSLLACLTLAVFAVGTAGAQSGNLLPKYGPQPKNEAQRAADQKFLASVDAEYKGDRKKAGGEIALRGWQLLRQGNPQDAMRRFNQAWLLDAGNGTALWGMAVVQMGAPGKTDEAMRLFAEADRLVGSDVDFAVDYAKALGQVGAGSRNEAMVGNAFRRYAQLHEKAPNHTLNLQNWAVTLYYVGNYAEAWKKIKLAEATPRRAEVDPKFIAALQAKMTRPD